MTTAPPIPPAERLAAILHWLTQLVVTRRLLGLLPGPVADEIIKRLREAKQRFARLAARIDAGTFVPRRVGARRPPVARKPPRQNPLPRSFGWLGPLVPDARACPTYLENFLNDPAVLALIAAAPAPMARILRPLCWMSRVRPPPVLASPRRAPAPKAATQPRKPRAPDHRPDHRPGPVARPAPAPPPRCRPRGPPRLA